MRIDRGISSLATRPGCTAFPVCPHCGDCLLAPATSEFIDSGEIRHTWSCDSCGGELQTRVMLQALSPEESPELVPE